MGFIILYLMRTSLIFVLFFLALAFGFNIVTVSPSNSEYKIPEVDDDVKVFVDSSSHVHGQQISRNHKYML